MVRKRKIAFVYGNFNILHPGHLRLLKFAKDSADYLIVGVNSNKLANNLHLFDEKTRLISVQSTSFVDESFILNEDPIEYIKKVTPDFVVKGKEHENGENREEDILKQYGGKLLFSSGEIGFTSLDLLQKEFMEINYFDIKHSYSYINRHNVSSKDLINIVEKFSSLNILVIGDTIVDEYITCNPIGMSQEDPTIVVTPISSKKFIGGAAIVASHAKKLGANVKFFSVLGNDEQFDFIQEYMQNTDIGSFIYKDTTRPTTLKQRFRADSKTLLRVNHLKQHKISKDMENNILKDLEQIVDTLDLIIFSDFSYGVLSEKIIINLTNMAKERDIFMAADSQSSSQIGDIAKFIDMDLITPTEREIRLSINDFESGLVVLAEKLSAKSNPSYIFTTLGKEGVMIYNAKEHELLTDNIQALNINPKDVSGAGDSLLICSAMSLCLGVDVWHSAYIGSLTAAIQVSRIGNVPIEKEELLKEIKNI